MRIDLTPVSMPDLANDRGSAVAGKGASVSAAVAGDDVARLDTGQESVSLMKAQIDAVPEIRQALVDRLRQAMSSGTYKVSPDGIADRMLAESSGRRG